MWHLLLRAEGRQWLGEAGDLPWDSPLLRGGVSQGLQLTASGSRFESRRHRRLAGGARGKCCRDPGERHHAASDQSSVLWEHQR